MEDSQRPTYVYIAKCCDGSYYTGSAGDVQKRLKQHNAGKGAKYTQGRRPVELVYSEVCVSRSAALKREYQIKRWKRVQKEKLILRGRTGPRRREVTESRLDPSSARHHGDER